MKARSILALISLLPLASVFAAEHVTVTVTHDLDLARPAETITVPWSEIASRLPGALLQRIVVKDWKGDAIPYQVTNVAPLAKDPENKGIACGDLIFQHDFAAGEQSAMFTVEMIDHVAPVFPSRRPPAILKSGSMISRGRTTRSRTALTDRRSPHRPLQVRATSGASA
ncbi:MAG: DUF4861 family protein [Opitutaceae bacterium]